MTNNPEDLVNDVIELISLPEIYIRVNEVMEDPQHDARQLGDVIGHDPSLTARILQIVNSAYYALAVKIDLVSRAVSVIGEDDLRNLVLATSAVETMEHIPNELVDINLFWQHSVLTGIIARLLSKQCNILHGERLFVAGLLHDIGKLILYFKEPDMASQVLMQAAESDGVLYKAEKEIIGFTHSDLGGALMKNWDMADSLVEVISYHHQPLNATQYPIETALVHIADSVVNAITPGIEIDEHLLDDMPLFEPATLEVTGIDLSVLPEIMDKARAQAGEVLDIIRPGRSRGQAR